MYFLIGISIILTTICIYLSIKLKTKFSVDNSILEEYNSEKNKLKNKIEQLNIQREDLEKDVVALNTCIDERSSTLQKLTNQEEVARQKYNEAIKDRTVELDLYYEERKQEQDKRLKDLYQKTIKEKNLEVELSYKTSIDYYENLERQLRERADCAARASDEIINEAYDRAMKAIEGTKEEEQKFQSLIEPILQYEKEQQQRLYYTIQVPDEYKDDIDFLLNTVSLKVKHPDIINKLVWAEYIKPYISDTFKRAQIEEKPGIYKLTSLITNKCYIGKSTNIKKRITDHFKSSIGIASIANQAVHNEILKQGYWNWTIEPIIYCEKEKLNEFEKYYINFFKSYGEGGYNKSGGGEG